MNYTESKLNEAKFFLDKLAEFYSKYPEFNYYLNAFIGSARSILWVMNSEFNKLDKWDEWYQSYELNKEENQFLKKINDLRITSVKRHPLEASEIINLEVVEESVTDELKEKLKKFDKKRVDIEMSIKEDGENATTNKDNEVSFKVKLKNGYLIVDDFPDLDILDVCKKYYSLLELIVKECIEKFGSFVDDEKNSWKRIWKFDNGDVLKT
ncbi:hypothetical protein [Neobacillus niacini]|uniref:hypothetical protein n=1 Tax=Neobacillus niacini TaxID=86668 RepID=UPI0021CB1E8D|nr:hypothetical protein [Neobacillus niacini]MCM3763432.1 hypothetical protein [Neobacillus niacini]